MALSALLLSNDLTLIQLLRPLLPEIGLQIDHSFSPDAARKLLGAQKYESLIVDIDTPGALEFMSSLRDLPMTRNAIIFAAISSTSMTTAFQAGANFVLEKPLSTDRVVRSFRAAQGLILRERRRYYRHPVLISATLEYGNKVEEVHLTNISEGGMALETASPLQPGQLVKWKFELPQTKISLEGKGEVSWTDNSGHAGIRFVHVPLTYKVRLEDWLSERAREEPLTVGPSLNRACSSTI